jgi:hypothetical protein
LRTHKQLDAYVAEFETQAMHLRTSSGLGNVAHPEHPVLIIPRRSPGSHVLPATTIVFENFDSIDEIQNNPSNNVASGHLDGADLAMQSRHDCCWSRERCVQDLQRGRVHTLELEYTRAAQQS